MKGKMASSLDGEREREEHLHHFFLAQGWGGGGGGRGSDSCERWFSDQSSKSTNVFISLNVYVHRKKQKDSEKIKKFSLSQLNQLSQQDHQMQSELNDIHDDAHKKKWLPESRIKMTDQSG